MIMDILNICMNKDCQVWTVKDGYRLGDDIQSKVLAFAFGLSAEIERNLISQRTIEALARKKSEGMTLGRPVGRKSNPDKLKCYKYRRRMETMLGVGMSYGEIGRRLGVHRSTVAKYVKSSLDTGGTDSKVIINNKVY